MCFFLLIIIIIFFFTKDVMYKKIKQKRYLRMRSHRTVFVSYEIGQLTIRTYERVSKTLFSYLKIVLTNFVSWNIFPYLTNFCKTGACFLSVIFCVLGGLWIVTIPHNGTLRQWFIVAGIQGDFCLLKSLLADINTTIHRYGANNTYPCVFNMKQITYPYL